MANVRHESETNVGGIEDLEPGSGIRYQVRFQHQFSTRGGSPKYFWNKCIYSFIASKVVIHRLSSHKRK